MTKTLKLNTTLFFALLLISGFAVYHQLGDFAHLKNADGVLTDMRSMVLWDIRFPRIGLALLTGASLAIAGNAMQGIFQNPLASPGLLGSSAGATAASVFILYYFAVPFSLLLAGGVIGALLSFFIVYLIAKNYGTTMMILSGLAVNMLLGSAIALLLSNAESPWALAELYRWLQGSLMWAKLDTLLISLPIVVVGIFCLYHTRRYLDLLTFGEETASTMGVDPKRSFFISTFRCGLISRCNHSTNWHHWLYRLNRATLRPYLTESSAITALPYECVNRGIIAVTGRFSHFIYPVVLTYLHRHVDCAYRCPLLDLDVINATEKNL